MTSRQIDAARRVIVRQMSARTVVIRVFLIKARHRKAAETRMGSGGVVSLCRRRQARAASSEVGGRGHGA